MPTISSVGHDLASDTAPRIIMAIAGLVFVLLMTFGWLMLGSQGGYITLDPRFFYQLLTAHGIGMVGTAGIAGVAIMWYFLRRYVPVSATVLWATVGLFLMGVVLILFSIFVMGFAAAWTFLYPLPAKSASVWEPASAIVYLIGLLLVGVAFLLVYLDVGRALISVYGGLGRALGWPMLFGNSQEAPPPTVVAATAVTIANTIGLVVGAAVIAISLVNLWLPQFDIDPLLAKNMIYFFGHVFINATIYMAVIAVYEIVPEYTGRPWKANRIFLAAWSATLLMVMAVYPHHLFQDTVMPSWALVMGQVLSYLSGVPVLVVTTLGLLGYLYGAGVRWDLPLALLVLGVFGWAAGAIPAVIDGMIVVNKIMHNTLWVPGHFHYYLLLGMVAMSWGFMAWLTRSSTTEGFSMLDRVLFAAYVVGGIGLSSIFLYAGSKSVPRRWAVHLPEWGFAGKLGAPMSLLVIAGALWFLVRYVMHSQLQLRAVPPAE